MPNSERYRGFDSEPIPRSRSLAIIVAVAAFLLGCSSHIVEFIWGGKHSTETLSFEGALETLRTDPDHQKRRVAAARVYHLVKRGVEAIAAESIAAPTERARDEAAVWLRKLEAHGGTDNYGDAESNRGGK